MIITLGTRSTLTLPAHLRKALALEAGDPVEVKIHDGHLILTPVATVPKRLRLTPAGEEKEAEADSDIKSGRVKVFDSAKSLLKDLHENCKG